MRKQATVELAIRLCKIALPNADRYDSFALGCMSIRYTVMNIEIYNAWVSKRHRKIQLKRSLSTNLPESFRECCSGSREG